MSSKKFRISPYVYPGIKRNHSFSSFDSKQLAISPKDILEIVSESTYVTIDDILSRSRKGDVIIARHIYCGIMRIHYNYSLPFIAKILHRDHTTIISAVESFNNRYKFEDRFKAYTDKVKKHIDLVTI